MQVTLSVNLNSAFNSRTTRLNPSSGAYDFPMWSKAFKSQLNEFDYEITQIDGKIPDNLSGTLFRNMPARFERADIAYGHYLDGNHIINTIIDCIV